MNNLKRFGAILAATVITTITIPTAQAQEAPTILGDASVFEASETYTAEVISRVGNNAVLQIELPDGTIETVFCLDYHKAFYSGNKYTFKGSEVQDVTKVQAPAVTDEVRSIVWDAGGLDGTTWRDLEGDELYAAMQVAIWIAANGETRTDYWGREVPADYCDGGLTECQRGWELYKDLKAGELDQAPEGLSLEVWEPQDDPTLQSVIRWTYEGPTGDEVNNPEEDTPEVPTETVVETITEQVPTTEIVTETETETEEIPTTVILTETEKVEVPTTVVETKVEEVPTTITEAKEIPTTVNETTTEVVTVTEEPVTETVTSEVTVTQEPETITEVVTETEALTEVVSETETVTDVVEKEVTVTETVTPEPVVETITETITHDPVTVTETTEVEVPVETTVTETETTEAPDTTVTVTEEPVEEPGDVVETTTVTEPVDEPETPVDETGTSTAGSEEPEAPADDEPDTPTFTIDPDIEIVVNIEDAGDVIQNAETQEVAVTGPEIVIPRLAPAGVEIPAPAQAAPQASSEAPEVSTPAQGVKRLAETGANVWWLVGAGAALLIAGAGLMVRRNK